MMKRPILIAMTMFAAALLFAGCGGPAANNSGSNNANKATNSTTANTTAAPAGDKSAAEADVRKVIDATQAALGKNDADAMDKIYADNYMTVNQDGSVQNRTERLAALRSGDVKYESFAFSDINLRVNSAADRAISISKLTLKGSFKGKPMDGVYRVTGIYGKMNDGWRLVGSQSTKIEEAGAPAASTGANANK
jgi:ketosteroid isomerase-like protein